MERFSASSAATTCFMAVRSIVAMASSTVLLPSGAFPARPPCCLPSHTTAKMIASETAKMTSAQGGRLERSGSCMSFSGVMSSAIDVEQLDQCEDWIHGEPGADHAGSGVAYGYANEEQETGAGRGDPDPRRDGLAG